MRSGKSVDKTVDATAVHARRIQWCGCATNSVWASAYIACVAGTNDPACHGPSSQAVQPRPRSKDAPSLKPMERRGLPVGTCRKWTCQKCGFRLWDRNQPARPEGGVTKAGRRCSLLCWRGSDWQIALMAALVRHTLRNDAEAPCRGIGVHGLHRRDVCQRDW